jgi:type II secretory pathway pseudopilin PulG
MKSAMRTPVGIPRRRSSRRAQRGLGLLVVLVVAGVLAVVLVGNALIGRDSEQMQDQATQMALTQAKEALIAYAGERMYDAIGDPDNAGVTIPDTPGHLPCPAVVPPTVTPEGSSAGTCGGENETVVGRLPWRTLGINAPRDGTGECLWYAVSGRFKHYPRGNETFNWDTAGQIRVINLDGSVLADNVAAVVMAPGAPIGQTRTPGGLAAICTGSHYPADYLEADPDPDRGISNSTMRSNDPDKPAISTMIAGGIDPATREVKFNDRFAIITAQELADAVARRKDFGPRALLPGGDGGQIGKLMAVLANCLSSAPDYRLPWAGGAVQAIPINQGGTTAAMLEIRAENGLLAGRAPSHDEAGLANVKAVSGRCDPASLETRRAVSWWNQWREHLFYAISPDFSKLAPPPVNPCGSLPNRCLGVNTSGSRYAAVLIFAGRRLAHQTRPQWSTGTPSPLDARQAYANYLEGINLTNIAAAPTWATAPSPGSMAYQYRSDSVASATQDDFAYCIEIIPPTITVAPCPPP